MEHLDINAGLNLDLSLSSMNDLHHQFNNNQVQQLQQDQADQQDQQEVVHDVPILGIDPNIEFHHHQPLNLPVLNPTLPSLEERTSQGISVIRGSIQCNRCKHSREVQINLTQAYTIIINFFINLDNRRIFFSRQDNSGDLMPDEDHLKCTNCKLITSMRPHSNSQINPRYWIFIVLGRWICMVDPVHLVGLFPGNEYVGNIRNLQFDSCIGLLSQLDPIGSQQLLHLYAPIWVL